MDSALRSTDDGKGASGLYQGGRLTCQTKYFCEVCGFQHVLGLAELGIMPTSAIIVEIHLC